MDWSSILSVIVALLVAIGLPLALRRRKKGGSLKREELCQHLQEIGVKASLAEKGRQEEKIGLSRASGQKSEGLIQVQGQKIDFINVISVASQYGTHYFTDYLVKTPNITAKRTLKKTYLVRKKSSLLWGKVVSVEWRGDKSLAQSLNFDYELEDKLLCCEPRDFGGSIQILPEPKHGCARIKTAYALASSDTLEAINAIAKHVRLW
jgi:hypothetical protein